MQIGTPCWIDLATTDLTATCEYYRGLFGWDIRASSTGDYLTGLVDDVPVAGMYHAPTEPAAPPSWTLYLTVADSERTAREVARLGGRVLLPPREFDGAGSLLVAADPTGATIGFWQHNGGLPFGTGMAGEFSWAELNTWEGRVADKFFAELFGYRQEQIGDGVDFDYTTWSLGVSPVLGRLSFGPDFPAETRPHWMVYFEVGSEVGTDEATLRAVQLGGRMLAEPSDSPFGRLSVLEDPCGATFTLIDTSHRTVPHAPAAEELGIAADDPHDD